MDRRSTQRMRSIHLTSIRELGPMGELLSVKLRGLHVLLARGLAETIGERGLKPGFVSCLSLIVANSGISQLELGQATGIDRTTMVAIMDYLEENELAVRQRSDEDRRRYHLFPTPKGKKELREIITTIKRNEDEILTRVPAHDLDRLVELLQQVMTVAIEAVQSTELAAAEAVDRQI